MLTAGAELGVGTVICTVGTGGAGTGGRVTRTVGVRTVGVLAVEGLIVVVCRCFVILLGLSGGGSAAALVGLAVGATEGAAIFSPRHAGLASRGWPGMVVTSVFLSCK